MRISDWSSDVCSSDLPGGIAEPVDRGDTDAPEPPVDQPVLGVEQIPPDQRDRDQRGHHRREIDRAEEAAPRSEEHTSELQSLMRISYAVFCLKKKIILEE